MMKVLMTCALAATLGAAIGDQGAEQDVALAARRFFRRDVGTTVEGVCRVPFTLLEPVQRGPDGFGAYRITFIVRDSSGLALTEQSWSQRVPLGMLDLKGAATVELFRFALAAGRYTVEATATDSASGRIMRAAASVTAFDGRPPASDLLLSGAIRQASDSTAGPGELARGGFVIAAQPEPVLTPSQSRLYYYVELYPGMAADVPVRARVLAQDGRELLSTAPETVAVNLSGSATSGLELAGLPPGEYALEVDLGLPDSTVRRRAAFRMAGFETQLSIGEAVNERAADVFARYTEDQLDSVYRPLVYLQQAGERGVYEGLSVEGKRNYLRQFWAKRDPSPDTPGNAVQEQFYAMIARANRDYREGGAGEVPGWRTDRGRIFVVYGEPSEVLRRPAAGATRPYEVWKYTRGKARKFVFLDETAFGHYVLIYTDERLEPSLPNWQELLGREAVLDVIRF